MAKTKPAVARHKRHKRVLKQAKGYRGGRSKLYRTAAETVLRAQRYAFRDRRAGKREMRALWITRIGAACRERDFNYSRFIQGLGAAGVALDRKMLSAVAVDDPKTFDALVEVAKKAIGK
ncbi:MAG TPA: 50S ribosomal protein L20 [Planctomycetota bacterium]|nr:50S ribosomal protein L20 [Planctomycetota bacterium]